MLKVKQVFRKDGPMDWMRIERILMPGYPEYDGALPGVSVRRSDSGGKGWQKDGWFVPACTEDQFLAKMKGDCRYPA